MCVFYLCSPFQTVFKRRLMVCICICYSSDSTAKLGLGSLVVPGVSELPRSVLVPDTTPK